MLAVTRFVIFSSLVTKNPRVRGDWGEARLQIPIKVFYWISTSQQRAGSEAAAGAGKEFNIINTWLIQAPDLEYSDSGQI